MFCVSFIWISTQYGKLVSHFKTYTHCLQLESRGCWKLFPSPTGYFMSHCPYDYYTCGLVFNQHTWQIISIFLYSCDTNSSNVLSMRIFVSIG